MENGLVHIYCGNGKGKTTASVGLAVRAKGAGLSVLFIQFIKGQNSSELLPLKNIGIEIARTPKEIGFIPFMDENEKQDCFEEQQKLINMAQESSKSGEYDLIILDEILGAIETEMVELNQVVDLISYRLKTVEIVLTGRNAPKELVEIADYVSKIKEVKHPYNNNQKARKGIEF